MIIRSNFTDYYDFVAHQNRDEKVVYERKITCIHYRQYWDWKTRVKTDGDKELCDTITNRYCHHTEQRSTADERKREYGIGLVIVGGKVYPFAYDDNMVSWSFNGVIEQECDVSDQQVKDFVKLNYATPYEQMSKEREKAKLDRHLWYNPAHAFERLKPGTELPEAITLCRSVGPVVLLTKCISAANYPLRLLKFPRNAHEVYQDISSFLMSVEPFIPEMDDKTKRDAHGFDDKTFKREPGGPTRKRKKFELHLPELERTVTKDEVSKMTVEETKELVSHVNTVSTMRVIAGWHSSPKVMLYVDDIDKTGW